MYTVYLLIWHNWSSWAAQSPGPCIKSVPNDYQWSATGHYCFSATTRALIVQDYWDNNVITWPWRRAHAASLSNISTNQTCRGDVTWQKAANTRAATLHVTTWRSCTEDKYRGIWNCVLLGVYPLYICFNLLTWCTSSIQSLLPLIYDTLNYVSWAVRGW